MKIYHNNRCSKSRQTLDLIQKANKPVEIFNYLEEELDKHELLFIVESLQIKPFDLIRKGEAIFKSEFKGKNLTDDEWLEAMLKYPKLIERPIVINGQKVVLGRPPENVLDFL
ncbi:MAG: arsenate reductase (glutaredoxin) [Putridiphycobacter sp.]|nr:arsenate reductase (glutaredoxin) [Putridiphycobacter sp.]